MYGYLSRELVRLMREEKRQARMREIEAVAYEVLAEHGYDGTSMLSVAKRARASNETLYRWYGDKNGLFESMVRANAQDVCKTLAAQAQEGIPPVAQLARLAPVLLGMLLGERAIALNRAAAADTTGGLGRALAAGGRDSVLPLLVNLIEDAVGAGQLVAPAQGNMAALFMHLLVGDQQIRRAIGTLPPPPPEQIEAQAGIAMAQFLALCGA